MSEMRDKMSDKMSAYFEVGDTVKLTGRHWDTFTGVEWRGTTVQIVGIDEGFPYFQVDGTPWYLSDPTGLGPWGAELVPANELGYDVIAKPEHYNTHPSGIEQIEISKHETFLRGNILKYVMRAPYKGSELQDLKKAKQYLDWEIERVTANA